MLVFSVFVVYSLLNLLIKQIFVSFKRLLEIKCWKYIFFIMYNCYDEYIRLVAKVVKHYSYVITIVKLHAVFLNVQKRGES